ncbi:hypothetical protein IGK47_000762 [Enterococcus sp. AZ007]
MSNNMVDFVITKDQVPEVRLNGELLGIVSCSYQWITKSLSSSTQCFLVISGLLGKEKVDLSINESTGEVFVQTYDCFKC